MQRPHARWFRTAVICLSIVPALMFSSVSSAQTQNVSGPTSTPLPGAGHDYIKLLNETVNPANGSLSVRIALPIPKGRGITIPVSIAYDSTGAWYLNPDVGTATDGATLLPQQGPLTVAGWSITLPHLSRFVTTFTEAGGMRWDGSIDCRATTGYVFTDAAGTSHNLQVSNIFNYFGGNGPDQESQACLDSNFRNQQTAGDVVYRAALVGADSGNYTTTEPSYHDGVPTVAGPDGTVYTFGYGWQMITDPESSINYGLATGIEDRNGNVVGISTNSGTTTMTDTLGRTALSVSSFPGSPTTNVDVPGLALFALNWTTLGSSSGIPMSPTMITGNPESCGLTGSAGYSGSVVSSVTLPNGQQYQFEYDANSGFLSKITFPSGGYVSYTWGQNPLSAEIDFPDSQLGNPCQYHYGTPVVTHRYVSYDGTTVALQQDFTYSPTVWANGYYWSDKSTTVTTHDLIRGPSYDTVYSYGLSSSNDTPNNTWTSLSQMPVERSIAYKGTDGSLLRTVTKGWSGPYELACELQSLDNGQISGTFYTYGTGAQVTDKKEYDYGLISTTDACQNGSVAPATTPTRETAITYQSFANTPIYSSGPSIFDRPSSVVVYGNGTRVAETDYAYDGAGLQNGSAAVGRDAQYNGNSGVARGNATTVIRKCLQSCPDATTTYVYDDTGQVRSATDPCGNATCSDMSGTGTHTTSYFYDDSYSSCGGSAPSGNTNAYLTKITNGLGQNQMYCYDYITGELRSSTDPNNKSTLYTYADPLLRLTKTDFPDFGQTTISYNDTPPSPTVTTVRKVDDSGTSLTSVSTMDGLGHVVGTVVTPDPDCPTGDRADTSYDGLGRVYTASSAYCSTGDPTYGLTSYLYDALGRVKQVTNPDASSVLTSYTGRATQVQDEGNGTQTVTRVSQSDAFGRLTSLCEVTSNSLIGSGGTPGACGQDISATGFLTSYQYNALDDLTQVDQAGIASRTFGYDSLSRLLNAYNPESGTMTYSYDANGNVSTKTDSRGIVTTNSYDLLNRLTAKTYSDGTPAAAFSYDQSAAMGVTLANTIGRLSSESTAGSSPTGSVFSYDQMGRVVDNSQCTPQNCPTSVFSIQYPQYDHLGNPLSATNGVGVTLSYGYSAFGRLQSVTSSLSDLTHPATLFSGATYNALGEMLSANEAGSTSESFGYNNRGRLQSASTNGFTGVAHSTGSAALSGSEQSIPGAPAAPGTGSVSFSGTLQSKQVLTQNATAGTGWGTVGGTEQSATTPATHSTASFTICCSAPISDSGTIYVTVGTATAHATYTTSSTANSVASALASALNGTGVVTASASGTTVNMTSVATGTGANYSFSSWTDSDNGLDPPKFTANPSDGTMTGGANGTTTYDTGSVWITVNAVQTSVSYGQTSTSSSLASGLVNAINSNGSLPVTAGLSGSTVNLTAKTAGSGTNYSLSAGSSTNLPGTFSNPSFTMSVSGASLTGGQDAVYTTVYDSGWATITVNGHNDSVNWSGSGTTTSSIASALASAINVDSSALVTASASGATVNLTAKTAGAGTNYSLSSSTTYDSGNFASPSFSSSNSGGSLTGGHDAGATTYDSGNVWVTVNGTQYSVSYGQNSTPTTLADSLAQAVNGDGSSVVTANSSSGTVNLTSKIGGSSTNYSLSCGSSTSQGGTFSQPSFSLGCSGMAGGADGSPATVYSVSLAYTPNGDVLTANDSVNGNWNYGYDAFNRLTCSNLVSNGPCSNPSNGLATYSYVYDRFGNRWQQNGPHSMQLSFSANNNRMDSYSYDAAGNLLSDGTHAYAYDAENRIISVDNGVTASYVYDAEGRRVRKTIAGGGSVDYLYDLSGHQIAEVNSSGGWNRGEIYGAGRHLATYYGGTTYFNQSDWLGTERVRTNISGESCETISSLPFGDGQTTSGSCTDASPMHFTGQERDTESGLNNFGARYDSSSLGRFMSPDPGNTAGDLGEWSNAQSWNAYAYVFGDPINSIDRDGLDCVYAGDYKYSGTVLIERGDKCSYQGGTYVNGTVDEKSLVYDQQTNQLSFNFADPEQQSGGSGVISLGAPLSESIGDSDRFDAVVMGVGLGEQGVNWAIQATVSNAVGAVVGGVVGEAIGSALTRVASKAALKAAQQELKALSPSQYKLLQAWLGKIKAGSPLSPPPVGLTREAMEAYLKVAKAYVEVGSTPGGMATQITRIRALESALGHP